MHELRKSTQVMGNVFLFRWYTTESLWVGAHGGQGEQARISMQKAARAQRGRNLCLVEENELVKTKGVDGPPLPL